jgi:TPR repeat protein
VLTVVHAFGVTLTEQEKLALAQVWAPSVDETQDDERCRNDDKDACTRIGLAFEAGRRADTAGKDKAREFYTRGCELLSAVACDSLGALIERGTGGQGDLARRAYGEGCALGHAPSCHPR